MTLQVFIYTLRICFDLAQSPAKKIGFGICSYVRALISLFNNFEVIKPRNGEIPSFITLRDLIIINVSK